MSSIGAAEEIDEVKERAHFQAVVNAFKYYKLCSLDRIHKSEKIISMLPPNHQKRLDKYRTYLTKFKKCLDVNNSVVHLIIKDVDTMFENVDHSMDGNTNDERYVFTAAHELLQHLRTHGLALQMTMKLTVARNVVAQYFGTRRGVEGCALKERRYDKWDFLSVRDWSDAGALEREQCYRPILDELEERYPHEECSGRSSVRVLVPGAGLGRLAWEVAARGFTCQGNEFSLFMLFASNFILNKCVQAESHTVHPWVHQYVNHLTSEHQTAAASFPDVPPAAPHHHRNNFSIAAGDFLKVYTEPGEWHCVATCFFIDCAPNVIEFIERIHAILRPGGLWLNLGPLLYHYSDMPTEISVEPPYDILLDIIKDVGFEILKEQTAVKTKYAQNPNSMMQHEYNSVFFVCRKPLC